MKFATILLAYFISVVFAGRIGSSDRRSYCHSRDKARRDALIAGCDTVSLYYSTGTLCNPYGCDCSWGCIESDGYYDNWVSYRCPNRMGVSNCWKDLCYLIILTQQDSRAMCAAIIESLPTGVTAGLLMRSPSQATCML
jgi:hypothetical protein